MSGDELERELTLMQACWAFFDDVRRRVSAEMQKGPRGGGRDRDHIVRHTFAAEQDWARMIGVLTPDGAMLTGKGLKAHRDGLLPCNTGLPLTGQVGRQDGEMAAPVSDPAYRLSHPGPRLGNGRQGSDDLTVK